MSEFKRLLSYSAPYKSKILLAFTLSILVSIFSLTIPWILKSFIDAILQEKNITKLSLVAFSIIIVTIFRSVSSYGQNYLLSLIGQRITMDFRNKIYQHLQNLSISFFDKQKTGDIISRITNDVGVLQNLYTSTLINIVTSPITIIGGIILILYLNFKLTLLSLIVLPIIVLSIHKLGNKIREISKLAQAKIADITQFLQERISLIRIVHSFARQNYEIDRFRSETNQAFLINMRGAKLGAFFYPAVDFLGIIGLVLVLFYGGLQVMNNNLTPGSLIAFLVYLNIIFTAFAGLSGAYSSIQTSLSAGDRIFEILDKRPDVKEEPDAIELKDVKGYVEFRNVSFSYNGTKESVLKNLSFKASPGEIVAIAGPSGIGKTTIACLLQRFYEPNEGEILIDGISIKRMKLDSLRNQIGVVHQEPLLFNKTIKENICYGKLEATNEEVINAAKIANAHNFIMQLPEGYETIIGERGITLSGGERQRIAIVRAIIKDPKILILDEATSSVDYQLETLIQETLKKRLKDKLVLIISHRASTTKMAEKFIRL